MLKMKWCATVFEFLSVACRAVTSSIKTEDRENHVTSMLYLYLYIYLYLNLYLYLYFSCIWIFICIFLYACCVSSTHFLNQDRRRRKSCHPTAVSWWWWRWCLKTKNLVPYSRRSLILGFRLPPMMTNNGPGWITRIYAHWRARVICKWRAEKMGQISRAFDARFTQISRALQKF